MLLEWFEAIANKIIACPLTSKGDWLCMGQGWAHGDDRTWVLSILWFHVIIQPQT